MGNSILVTGPGQTFVYLKYTTNEDKEPMFNSDHTQINNLEEGREISNNYTCHSWAMDTGLLIVCTDNGQILICDNNGEYKVFFLGSPVGEYIEAIIPISNGFLVAIDDKLMLLRSDNGDDRAPMR